MYYVLFYTKMKARVSLSLSLSRFRRKIIYMGNFESIPLSNLAKLTRMFFFLSINYRYPPQHILLHISTPPPPEFIVWICHPIRKKFQVFPVEYQIRQDDEYQWSTSLKCTLHKTFSISIMKTGYNDGEEISSEKWYLVNILIRSWYKYSTRKLNCWCSNSSEAINSNKKFNKLMFKMYYYVYWVWLMPKRVNNINL